MTRGPSAPDADRNRASIAGRCPFSGRGTTPAGRRARAGGGPAGPPGSRPGAADRRAGRTGPAAVPPGPGSGRARCFWSAGCAARQGQWRQVGRQLVGQRDQCLDAAGAGTYHDHVTSGHAALPVRRGRSDAPAVRRRGQIPRTGVGRRLDHRDPSILAQRYPFCPLESSRRSSTSSPARSSAASRRCRAAWADDLPRRRHGRLPPARARRPPGRARSLNAASPRPP